MTDTTHRKESIQRVQVGLTGLGGIVILLALVNIVVSNVRSGEGADRGTVAVVGNDGAAANVTIVPKEPLAELGVTPSISSDGAVPDLKPDPNLRKPMDREPARPAER